MVTRRLEHAQRTALIREYVTHRDLIITAMRLRSVIVFGLGCPLFQTTHPPLVIETSP